MSFTRITQSWEKRSTLDSLHIEQQIEEQRGHDPDLRMGNNPDLQFVQALNPLQAALKRDKQEYGFPGNKVFRARFEDRLKYKFERNHPSLETPSDGAKTNTRLWERQDSNHGLKLSIFNNPEDFRGLGDEEIGFLYSYGFGGGFGNVLSA